MKESSRIIFETERTIVREFVRTDVADLEELYTKQETFEYEFEHPLEDYKLDDYLLEIIQSYRYDNPLEYLYGVELKDENKIIGLFTYSLIDPQGLVSEVGGWLNSSYWRRGLAKEVGSASLKYLFSKDIQKIACSSFFQNKNSVELIESLGFKKEGHVKMAVWLKDQYFDEVLYGFFKEDFISESTS